MYLFNINVEVILKMLEKLSSSYRLVQKKSDHGAWVPPLEVGTWDWRGDFWCWSICPYWLTERPRIGRRRGTASPCSTVLKQSKMHVQHQRVFLLQSVPGGVLALSAAPMDHREASRPPKPRCTGPPRPCKWARGVGVMVISWPWKHDKTWDLLTILYL